MPSRFRPLTQSTAVEVVQFVIGEPIRLVFVVFVRQFDEVFVNAFEMHITAHPQGGHNIVVVDVVHPRRELDAGVRKHVC